MDDSQGGSQASADLTPTKAAPKLKWITSASSSYVYRFAFLPTNELETVGDLYVNYCKRVRGARRPTVTCVYQGVSVKLYRGLLFASSRGTYAQRHLHPLPYAIV